MANISTKNEWNLTKSFTSITQISLNTIEYDSKYCVIYDFWKSDPEFREGNHITLILHSTPLYLEYLKKQAETWQGGISISIFIPSPRHFKNRNGTTILSTSQLHLQTIFAVIDSMKEELKENIQKISMHLFFEKSDFKKCPILDLQKLSFLPTLMDLSDFSPPAELYPINPARNIARLGSRTKLFISGDIEQIFVENFEAQILKLGNKVLLKEKQAIVLVHRRFEIDFNAPEPKTKADLRKLIKEKKAVPFHFYVYPKGHNIPGLEEWLESKPKNAVTIEKIINYTNAEWEPQFVGDERVPFHDNRFPFRLRSNTHLGTVLCYSGFKFAIVNDLFTYHRGIKEVESKKDTTIKDLSFKQGYHKTKADLRKLIKEKKAVPFHFYVYPKGHNILGLEEWLESKPKNAVTIEKIINYTNAEWEPQFVGDERVPFHDNRFPFRLRSNTHLGTVLCYSGFKFAIVNDLFTYHRGIKEVESKKDTTIKDLSFKQGYHK
uniref:N-acetyllactosaminide beta-1,3-N-acetylglucosaminyltransferase n=1 Tax=Panagrolaimus sp. ES5 TaxID=591445 RepID=A0AC34FU35_9BILA